ncbi:MAG: GNAT family N-acetyltransferase [SAR202 cluster bacterium]|nr:GNAT family N-acetyltransferase [SAR202 cluster bacterium]
MIPISGNTLSFDESRSIWGKHLSLQNWNSVFMTPEWQESWWSIYGDNYTLQLIHILSDKRSLGIAPLALNKRKLTFIGDTDLFDYHDFITNNDDFYPHLFETIKSIDWDTLELVSVPEWSPTYSLLPSAALAQGYNVAIEFEDVVPGISLPPSWEEYLGLLNKKDRHELRRKIRRLENAGDLYLRTSNAITLQQDLKLFMSMMAESKEDKKNFLIPKRESFLQSIAVKMQDSNFLKLFILELNETPVSALMCFDYKNTRLVYNSGYVGSYANLSVGLVLKAFCIKDAIESKLAYFDLLRGPEAYKYHLGAIDSNIHKLVVSRSLV